jgi:hypothetical protein
MNDLQPHPKSSPLRTLGRFLLIGLLIIVFFPIIFGYFLLDVYLRLQFLRVYKSQGKFIILVYSDSPDWKPYIDNNWLRIIRSYSIVLNWSERKKWNYWSWPVRAFKHWGGGKNFNPMAIILAGGVKIEVIRFFEAFKDFKHGKEVPLRTAENQLFELVKARLKNQKSN